MSSTQRADSDRIARILIVDDDPTIRELVMMNLEAGGFGVAALDGGTDAKSAADHLSPDLLILDVMMPEVDGFAVLESLRSDPKTRDIPVLLLSAKATSDDVHAGLEAGADAYVTKPFCPDELQQEVERLLLGDL